MGRIEGFSPRGDGNNQIVGPKGPTCGWETSNILDKDAKIDPQIANR